MKKHRLICAVLAAGLLLTSCAGPRLTPGERTTETVPENGNVFHAEVTLSGDGRADSTIRARVKTDARGEMDYCWLLDGRELRTRGDTLRIPCSAGDRQLVCRVTCRGMEGAAESEALTVMPGTKNGIYTMAGLFEDVKWINRTEPVGSGMTADWSVSGFEMNLRSSGGEFRVDYMAGTPVYFAVFVDGEPVSRPLLKGTDSFAVELAPGEHTVRVCRETEIVTSSAGVVLNSVSFEGEVLERPADKELLIHVIGDSISCGDGALGTFKEGEVWVLSDHSGTNGFGYLVSQMLDADYDLVSRGGIGLVKASGVYNIGQLYDYVNRYRSAKKYDFEHARVPDVILLEQGANDLSVTSAEEYYQALLNFIGMLREKWGDEPVILWVGFHQSQYESALLAKKALSSDPRYFVFKTSAGGAGSAALATQKAGHPSAAEQREMAVGIVDLLREKGVV